MNLEKDIRNRFRDTKEVSVHDLTQFLQSMYPTMAKKTLTWHIHMLKKKGVLHHVSRGVYSFLEKRTFLPPISSDLNKLYTKIHKDLPYVRICVWDTRWFNEFLNLQLFKHFLAIEVEKDVAEAIHNRLVSANESVFLDPDKKIFDFYIANHEEVIIVKTLISEAPTQTVNGIEIASLEKLLVDCIADPVTFGAQQNELDNIFESAFVRYKVNISTLKRYAARRNKLRELESHLKTLIQNYKTSSDVK